MAKRFSNSDVAKVMEDIKFDLSNSIFLTVGFFRNKTLIQFRKFSGGLRTNVGVGLYPEEFEKIIENIAQKKKMVTVGRFTLTRGVATLKVARKDGKFIVLPDECVVNLESRLV